jgi:hypothetical protein
MTTKDPNPTSFQRRLSSKSIEKFSLLVSLAIRVNKIIGKGVTSRDLEVVPVVPVPPATTFDGTMED